MINSANIRAFSQAASARGRALKASGDDDTCCTGVLLLHATGAIHALVGMGHTIDPEDLSEVFKVGHTDETYADEVPAATREIKNICKTLNL